MVSTRPTSRSCRPQYERNPGSVSDEWRLFFESLQEDRGHAGLEQHGPSWAVPLSELEQNGDLVSALTGDYGATERELRSRIQQRAHDAGYELSGVASLRATQDSIRALMLIRAYRVMGHSPPTSTRSASPIARSTAS